MNEEQNEQLQEDEIQKVQRNNKKKKSSAGIVICVLVIVVCLVGISASKVLTGNNTETTKVEKEKVITKSDYRISGNGLEDFDLYFLQLENNQTNKIYSPLSIKYALAMLNEGTEGDTHDQIESVIGDYQAKKYNNNEHMSFANAMFIRNSFQSNVNNTYTENLSNNFGAEIIYDPFESSSNINSWVSNKTFSLVKDLVDDSTVKDGNFFLVNALAIDMNWTSRIQSATAPLPEGMTQNYYSVKYSHEKYSDFISTIEEDVYPSMDFNGEQNIKSVEVGASFNHYDIVSDLGEENIRKTVGDKYQEYIDKNGPECGSLQEYLDGYMKDLDKNYKDEYIKDKTSTEFSIYTDEEVKVFAKNLQNYDGTTLQYVGIMPNEVSLKEYVNKLNSKSLNEIIGNLKEVKYENFKDGVVTKIKGSIPLFKFDYQLDLMNNLQTLGIKDVFDINKANLSKMLTGEKQYISSAIHKANIEFSNDGIKAAAATSMGGAGATGCGFDYLYEVPVEEIDITFDKPYLFLIRDLKTGEVWFTGTVYNPVKN